MNRTVFYYEQDVRFFIIFTSKGIENVASTPFRTYRFNLSAFGTHSGRAIFVQRRKVISGYLISSIWFQCRSICPDDKTNRRILRFGPYIIHHYPQRGGYPRKNPFFGPAGVPNQIISDKRAVPSSINRTLYDSVRDPARIMRACVRQKLCSSGRYGRISELSAKFVAEWMHLRLSWSMRRRPCRAPRD